MSDVEQGGQLLVGDGDDSNSDGPVGGSLGCCGKIQSAFCKLFLGILAFPGALFLIGMNERNYVCTQKNIYFADEKAGVVPCNAASSVPDGSPVFFSCPLDQSSLRTFTPSSFNGEMGPNSFGSAISFTGVEGVQEAEMWQCVEQCRTEGEGKQQRKVCTYSAQWVGHYVDASRFKSPGLCPGGFGQNPPWPSNVQSSNQVQRADTVRAGSFTLLAPLLAGGAGVGISADLNRPMDLSPFASQFPKSPANMSLPPVFGGFGSLTLDNVALDASRTALVTCSDYARRPGCMRLRYYKDRATTVSAISSVHADGTTGPMRTPSSWGCSAGNYQALFPEPVSKDELVGRLHAANDTTTILLRIVGVVAAWLAVWCCLSPISTAADLLGDCLNFIPCVGGCLESMVEGIVDSILCVISCGFGCSCALCVMGIVWLVMRPLYGGLLLGGCVLLFLGAYALTHVSRNPAHAKKREFSRHVEDSSEVE